MSLDKYKIKSFWSINWDQTEENNNRFSLLSLLSWFHDLRVPWSTRSLVFWFSSLPVSWSPGSLVYSFRSLLVLWSPGLLVILVPWFHSATFLCLLISLSYSFPDLQVFPGFMASVNADTFSRLVIWSTAFQSPDSVRPFWLLDLLV